MRAQRRSHGSKMTVQGKIRSGNCGMTRHKSRRTVMSHDQLMDRRWSKMQKKQGDTKTAKHHLSEYMKYSKIEAGDKKTCARSIMDIVEEINEEGMNDMRYMTIMNSLMSLHKEDDLVSLMDHMNAAAQRHRLWEPDRTEWLDNHLRENTIAIVRDIDTPYIPNDEITIPVSGLTTMERINNGIARNTDHIVVGSAGGRFGNFGFGGRSVSTVAREAATPPYTVVFDSDRLRAGLGDIEAAHRAGLEH